jgi:hypothetical protein
MRCAVLHYLERAGIQPRTCEEYFLTQLQNDNLNAERLEAILSACPAAAYGIILEERERRPLDEQCPEWLPAAVPVFSMQDMSRILAGTSDTQAMLAQYAAEPTYGRTSYDMWQYTSKGTIAGISGKVDLNLSYLNY